MFLYTSHIGRLIHWKTYYWIQGFNILSFSWVKDSFNRETSARICVQEVIQYQKPKEMLTSDTLVTQTFRILRPSFFRQKDPKPVAINLKSKKLENNAKLERQKKRADKIPFSTKNNIKCKDYIGSICLGHIQQEFQAVWKNYSTHDLWEWPKKRYTLQNTASKLETITSMDKLTYTTYKKVWQSMIPSTILPRLW